MRWISRVMDVWINTVTKLLVDASRACAAYHDEHARHVAAKRVQCDEIWSFAYAKEKNVPNAKAAPAVAGDVWTWTAICADTNLVPSWLVGDRGAEPAAEFVNDLASRMAYRVQVTSETATMRISRLLKGRSGPMWTTASW